MLVTDRRAIVAWTRSSPPVLLSHGCQARYEHDRLVLASDDIDVVLDAVDPRDARQIVALLSRRQGQPLGDRMGPGSHVRIIG